MQFIGVVDGNNFFVSCERLFRPDLLGRPVVVLSSNDGCVVARSQEIKDMGILMGVPYFQVKDILKKSNATAFSSHFALYRDISARVFTEARKLLPVMEQYSIDEAFFRFEAESKDVAIAEMRKVKQQLELRVGIPVSIGLAATKTQAKYANRLAKKAGGVVVLDGNEWLAKVSAIPLADIWGVGGRLSAKYRTAGLLTVADLLATAKPRLTTLFGISGLRLQAELAGEVMYPVTRKTALQQSIMSTGSFKTTTESLVVIKDSVAYHIRHAAADLRAQGLGARTLYVSIRPSRHGDYVLRGGSDSIDFGTVTDDSALLMAEAMRMVERLFEAGVPYKKAGITLGQLAGVAARQTSLFAPTPETLVAGELMKTIDGINGRFGQDTLKLGQHTKQATWSASRADLSPAYTTKWAAVPTVRA